LGQSTSQLVGSAGTIATPVVSGVLATSSAASVAAGGTGLILGMAPALAIPIVGAALAGVTLAIEAILNSGCGQSCIITSNWANQAATLLQQNLDAYMALPAPRTVSQQAAALDNFNSFWNYLVQECSAPSVGTAGQHCISDREAGACHYETNGVCWNWFVGYHDPIANDSVVPDTVSTAASTVASSVSSALTSAGLPTWALPALLVLVAVVLL
jgi:hypothetical protein